MTKWQLLVLTGCFLSVACKRLDPLSARGNGGGHILEDVLVGDDKRLVCVTTTLGDCSPKNAELVVRNVPNFFQVKARWRDHETVGVQVYGGDIQRAVSRSRDGSIKVQVDRLPLSAVNGASYF